MSSTRYNPIVPFIYFPAVSGIAMFSMNPLLILISLAGALFFFILQNGLRHLSSHFFFLGLFVVMALINPLFYHNGETVLFFLNNNPITFEALFYGIISSAMIICVIYWFRSFSAIMTSDRLMYVFGRIFPKFALLFSMALRYIPLLRTRARNVKEAQKTLGLYKKDSVPDLLRADLRVFSIMATWSLENGIITADSMSARGYASAPRTSFSLYRFRKSDAAILVTVLLLFCITLAGLATHALDFGYYPRLSATNADYFSLISYLSYALLTLFPSLIKIKENIKWKFLKSKI